MKLDKKRPKIQSKSIWGGSWALFGRGLGSSWASFGCFWPPRGRFLNVQNRTSFKHLPKMGSRRASGWILARFAKVLGGFGEGLGKILEGFWAFGTHSRKILEMLGMISPCWGRFSKMDPRADPRSVTMRGGPPPSVLNLVPECSLFHFPS